MRIRIGASLSGAPISVARLIYIREGGGLEGGTGEAASKALLSHPPAMLF